MHPDGVKRAVMAGLGLAMVSTLTVEEDVRRKHLAIVAMKGDLPSRPIVVVDHPQKHHGAACRAMLRAFETAFAMKPDSTS
jgi:DNA-binding transcriptional LysR family regulator